MTAPAPAVIAGRYELGEPLGRGGTATVYRALDRELLVERAVKLLTVAPRYRAGLRRRLKREAQAMAALDSAHLLRVYDVGVDGDHDYVVMDLAEGGSLSDVLDEHGPMPPITALVYTIHLLAALDAAHAARVIHRDIKPQNILLTRDGVARLADFGIALLDREDLERHTQAGALMGSLAYMAPEQRQDARVVGPEADLYAAGCTLFNLLTGASPLDLFLAAPSSPRWLGIPPAVQALLMRATRPEPSERYASAREMARDIAGLLPMVPNIPGPVHPPGHSTQAALQALLGGTPLAPARPAPRPVSTAPPAHPPTVVPSDDDEVEEEDDDARIGPTLLPPTQVPTPSEGARLPRWAGALLGLLGLGALGLGASMLRDTTATPTVSAAHLPLAIEAPQVRTLPSPRATVTDALATLQTERYRSPAPAATATKPPTPQATASCAAYPAGAGSSPASGTWKGMRALTQGVVNITLTLGGPPEAITGCSLVTFLGETRAYPARGSLSGDTLTLHEGDGYSYTLTVDTNNLQGTFRSGQGPSPASFKRTR